MKPIFEGCCTAMITPFTEQGKLDLRALKRQTEYQLENGVDALLALGTTGEATVLTEKERKAVIRTVIRTVNGKVPVLVGAGSNDTQKALRFALTAQDEGADAQLQVTPYYNKTTQTGLIRHYYYIADRCTLPMLVYNVPSRTGMNIHPETYSELSKHPVIVGTKEANGNLASMLETARLCGKDFYLYAGSDDLIVPSLSVGAKGAISVLSNLLPREVSDLCRTFRAGNTDEAAAVQTSLHELITALFKETNPIPVKAAMKCLGLDSGITRLPLTEISPAALSALTAALINRNLIEQSEA